MDAAPSAAGRDGEEKKKEGGGEHGKRVSFTGMFQYADTMDLLLMLVGTLAAMGNGVTQPLMTVLLGDVINAFGGATTGNVLHRVNKVSRAPTFRLSDQLVFVIPNNTQEPRSFWLPCSIDSLSNGRMWHVDF